MLELIRRIKKCDQGTTAVEYSLISSIIVIGIIVSLTQVSIYNDDIWNIISSNFIENNN
jgi:Flp pilus assembly pilin Flp